MNEIGNFNLNLISKFFSWDPFNQLSAILLILGTINLTFFYPSFILADISGLITCADSFMFTKQLDQRIKQFIVSLSKTDSGNLHYLNVKSQIGKIKDRFNAYSRQNLLCGEEGLPHLIVDGRWSHADEFILPGIIFLYISGWIGWSGRRYLDYSKKLNNPFKREYIIHVPMALIVMFSSASWPVNACKTRKKFTVLDEKITVSTR